MRSSARIALPALLSATIHCLRSLAPCPALLPATLLVVGVLGHSGFAQMPQIPVFSPTDAVIPRPVMDSLQRVEMRGSPMNAPTEPRTAGKDDTCLLPPLTLVHSPTVVTTALKIPKNAKKEYGKACAAMKDNKIEDAESHLSKAVDVYPAYAAAWVTLGQILAAQEKIDEARAACSEGLRVEPGYLPSYLCLADLGARQNAWDEVLRLSSRAIESDPGKNAVAYEYNAAANLRIHKLDDAEKSALRAVDIDKDHHEPRVHFVLAQIYEAKGDPANEAAQLREYLKYADSPNDVAMVKQFLAKLDENTGKDPVGKDKDKEQSGKERPVNPASGASSTGGIWSSAERWAPADIDETVPPVRSDITCPLPQILKETSKRTENLIEDLQLFSASESIQQIDVGKNGKKRNSATQVVNYVAQIEQNASGYPSVEEYRSGSHGVGQASVVDTGTAAFALIFHPTHLGSFDFRCEGLSELRGSPAWQVHFEENADPNQAFQSLRVGRSLYLPRLKGRAWIATDSYAVVRIETDLVSPIPQIDLQLAHQVIVYAPVEFQQHHVRLWLPASASLYIAHRGHRYERVHTFSQFQLFAVDAAQAIKKPPASSDGQLQ